MNFHKIQPHSISRFLKKLFIEIIFIFLLFSLCSVAYGQYDTNFLTIDPYVNNGCIEFGSQEVSKVNQINDFIGVTTNPPPILATFTGGRKVGSYFQSCMGMVGYATSRKDKYGNLTNLPNKIDVNFNKSVKFKRIDIDGKFPQRVKVTIDGGASVEVDLNDDYPIGDGYGHKAVFVYDIFGDATPRQFSNISVSSTDSENWRFGVYSIDYFDPTPRNAPPPPPNYCNVTPIGRPSPQNLSAYDWTMNAEVSDTDGLVLSDIRLKGRKMAEKISVPYYQIVTNQTPSLRGELRPNDTGGTLRSRLVSYKAETNDERLIIEAVYTIDNISSSQSCLTITQRYEFLKEGLYGLCTPPSPYPLNSAQCSRWRALVSYNFKGNGGETLQSLNIAQRNHFKVNGYDKNSVGLFKDCDSAPPSGLGCIPYGIVFKGKLNPLYSETYSPVIVNGEQTKLWDNMHQTYLAYVSEPLGNILSSDFTAAGCPECVHSHWRWGAGFGEHFGNGEPFVPSGSNQDQSIAIVKYRSGEEHPNNLFDLISFTNPEPIRSKISIEDYYERDHYDFTKPEEVVYWISAKGRKPVDEFFGYYSFFIPSDAGVNRMVIPDPLLTGFKPENSNSLTGEDAPTSINYGFLYTDGDTRYTERDPATIAPLPNAYVPYSNVAYDVRSEAAVSGPHTITFNLPSVTDQTTFNSLRILHSEPDSFDPTKAVWVDRTILAPEPPAPDFANRNLSAKVNEVGPFIIAQLVNPSAPNTNSANLSLSVVESADPVIAGNDLTYTINVTNNGPNMATGVALSSGLSPDVDFISADAGTRFCNHLTGAVVCNLDSIASGATIPVTITVKPNEGQTRFPTEGKSIIISVFVIANEIDSDENSNSVSESTLALPNPNAPPTVQIQTPAAETILTGPASFSSIVKAFDSDGTISQVELFEDGQSVGSCVNLAPGSPYCSISRSNVSYGKHKLVAVAIDNGGRKAVSESIEYFINGPATINLTTPVQNTVYSRPANITLTALAVNQSGSIGQVEFFANGESLGVKTSPTTGNQYDFVWNNAPTGIHLLRAVAVDGNGVKSYSYSSKIMVTNQPAVNITSPLSGASFPKPADITFTAQATDFDGYISKVAFFADGTTLIGEGTLSQGDLYNFTWSNAPAGIRSIRAVATDNSGNTSISSPITVTVTNNPPNVSLTSPANDSIFTAPASITVSANAADSDGTVSMVEFFDGSTLIGQSYYPPYEFIWNNVIAGTHNLTAVARDDDGVTSASAPVTITVNAIGNALLVVGNTTLSAVDTAIKTRLESLGLNVIVKSATSAASADANGKLVVVISDSVSPTNVNTKFRTVVVPVVTLDPQLFDDMGMTPTTSGNFGTTSSQKNVSISNSAHPMAMGMSGIVQVTTSNTTFGWGKINANGIKIATLTSDSTKATSFGYESGVAMPGLNAPARRVGFFYTASSTNLTYDGELLFEAALKWATGF